MLNRLRTLLGQSSAADADSHSSEPRDHSVRLATAALLVEVARADFQEDDIEKDEVCDLLTNHFELEKSEVLALFDRATTAVDESIALQPFTETLRKSLSEEEREFVVEMMWIVVYADGVKDQNEEYLVRKVAGLLHVPQQRFIAAKLRVEKEAK